MCVTPGAGFVSPFGAFCMGAAAAVVCRWSCLTLKHKLGYDDALDVWGVHGMGGLLGGEGVAGRARRKVGDRGVSLMPLYPFGVARILSSSGRKTSR